MSYARCSLQGQAYLLLIKTRNCLSERYLFSVIKILLLLNHLTDYSGQVLDFCLLSTIPSL